MSKIDISTDIQFVGIEAYNLERRMEMEEKKKLANDLIDEVTKRINANPEKSKGWGKALKLIFKDIDMAYWLKLSMDGTVETVEKGSITQLETKESVATLNMTTDTFQGVLNGSISPVGAFLKGAIKIQGSIDALLKLASAFDMT
jgi:putative sterol carrier protein